MSLSHRFPICILALSGSVLLGACGSSEPSESSETRTEQGYSSPNGGSDAETLNMISLFSESLHDLPMPGPGTARIEAFGAIHEFELSRDCSVASEPPPADGNWGGHIFDSSITGQLDDGTRILVDFARRIYLDESAWTGFGHESESITMRFIRRSGNQETRQVYQYRMQRTRPGDSPKATWSDWEPLGTVGPDFQPPLIRVHPDGHRATFKGQLGEFPSERPTEPHEQDLVEVRISISCA